MTPPASAQDLPGDAQSASVAEDSQAAPRKPVGTKYDAGKEKVRLILHGMPRAVIAVAEVATFGAAKYAEGDWLLLRDGVNRYTDALMRHLLREGVEERDEDSGLLHAAQVAWNALARLELMLPPTILNHVL